MTASTVSILRTTASRKSIPKLVFRPEGARRPFRSGDLALLLGSSDSSIPASIVVVCMSEDNTNEPNPELVIRSTRGVSGSARAHSLHLLAGVDTQEYGPGYHDLIKFIADIGAVAQ
jgi:hypothetical protein